MADPWLYQIADRGDLGGSARGWRSEVFVFVREDAFIRRRDALTYSRYHPQVERLKGGAKEEP